LRLSTNQQRDFLGATGWGKNTLSVALAEEAIRRDWVHIHHRARSGSGFGRAYREGRLDRRMPCTWRRSFVIDRSGYLTVDDLGATIFFQLVSARTTRKHILTSNKSYGEWDRSSDSIIATAILDRLLHHSTTIQHPGESYRTEDRRKAGLVRLRQEGGAAARSLASDSVTPKTRQKTAWAPLRPRQGGHS